MTAVALQRPFLHHLHLQSHLHVAVSPFCRPRGLVCGSRGVRFSTRSLFWGSSGDLGLRGKRGEGDFGLGGGGKGNVSLPWGCRSAVGSQKVAQRGLKKSTEVVEEEMSAMESKTSNRKRPSLQPKQLSLRTAAVHGSTFISFVQILGTGMDTRDTSASVLLFFDKRRIIFNAGEGLQRFCIEHKIKLSKACNLAQISDGGHGNLATTLFPGSHVTVIGACEQLDHIFLTRVCSETTSGLPGLLLTLANTGENGMAVNLWGPSDLKYLVDAMRTFIPNSSVVHTHSFGGEEEASSGKSPRSKGTSMASEEDSIMLLEDECVKISAVLLHSKPSRTNSIDRKLTDVSNKDATEGSLRKSRSPKSSEQRETVIKGQGSRFQFAEPWELGFESGVAQEMISAQKRPRVEPPLASKTLLVTESPSELSKPMPRLGSEMSTAREGSDQTNDVAVVYVCELPEIIGKFDPEKAKALGLRPGPKYGLLQSGKDVKTDDGRTIHPCDVMDPSSPGPICLIVDCSTTYHVSALVSAPGLQRFYLKPSSGDGTESSKRVTCIIHIGPARVTNSPQYQQWMTRFKDTQHLMAGHGMHNKVSPVLKASARIMSRLNYICPQVFPITGLLHNENLMDSQDEMMNPGSITVAENLLKFRLRPLSTTGVDRSGVPEPLDVLAVQTQLVSDIPELVVASQQLAELWNAMSNSQGNLGSSRAESGDDSGSPTSRKRASKKKAQVLQKGGKDSSALMEDIPSCLEGLDREEMEMVFLGTGSSQPSKYRNVSAIYVHLFKRGGLLLDCGEGTYAQLKRRYGTRAADDVVAGLKLVWISHIHADHHTGLARILSVRKKLLEEQGQFQRALVVGPKQLKRYLDAYEKLEDLGMEFLDCSQTTYDAESVASLSWASEPRGEVDGQVDESVGKPIASGGSTSSIAPKTGLLRTSSAKGLIDKNPSGGGQLRSYWLQTGFNLQAGLDEEGRSKLKGTLAALGLELLISVPVVHCPHAFGVVLVAQKRSIDQPGWKLVYSGDTRPCRALVEASKGATVLIHEATFDDAMPEEAIAKNHSMTREAIETGITAGAFRTILTHFSQRYPKIPVFNESYDDRTCIAFDMMSANLVDLPLLPKLLPALKLLFKDDMMTVDEETEDLLEP